jgi:mono/diheme cytochrome c family protein
MRLRLLLFVLAGACAACTDGFERMTTQEKFLPYTENPMFPDDRAMRTPPAGTVPREREVGDPVRTTGLSGGKPVTSIPIGVDRALLDRGRDHFTSGCAPCHGELGDGRSGVAVNMALRPPPSLHDFRDRPDGFFFQVITEGFGVMPSYSSELAVDDRWAVVAYVRALELSQHAPIEAVPPDESARLESQKESP